MKNLDSSRMKRPQIIQAIKKTLHKVAPSAEVILYGSEARGDAHEDSDDEERSLLIVYRMRRAKETLLEADSLIENGFFNAAVNRLYYACYYAVIALKFIAVIEKEIYFKADEFIN
jgi:predicted nucleotidyltransferase